VYPVGTLVELNSGEVAVVIGQNHDARLLPRIGLVRDRNKQPVDERIVNLKHLTGSDGIARFRIKTMLHDGSYGIFMRDYTRQLVLGNNTAH
jgi:hypothetical protein